MLALGGGRFRSKGDEARAQQLEAWKNSPIGFYFAKLWYYEKQYPLVFGAAALTGLNRLYGEQIDQVTEPIPAKIPMA